MRLLLAAVLSLPSLAAADTTPAALLATEKPVESPPAASLLEPGTLDRGDLGIRGGFGIGDGFLGFGVQGFVGLGGLDLIANASYLPGFCIGGLGCDLGNLGLGFGAQVKLASTRRLHLGARVQGTASVTGERIGLATGSLIATTGSQRVRVSLAPTVFAWSEADNPFDENGWYVGGTLGLAYLMRHGGIELTLGAAAPLYNQPELMPLIAISYFART